MAEKIKKRVHVPVIAVGSIRNPEFAEAILEGQKADLVAMGRQLLADPYWVKKVSEGRNDEIRRCIRCNNCIEQYGMGNLFPARSMLQQAGKKVFLQFPPNNVNGSWS